MNFRIAVIKGDGIGPEVVNQAIKVMDAVGRKFGHQFLYTDVLAGGAAIDAVGEPLPRETVKIAKESDAVLFGAVGGAKWDKLPLEERPEQGLLKLRKALGLYANLRQAMVFDKLASASPLKADIIGQGLDIVVVRELTGGIYFGNKGYQDTDPRDGLVAFDVEQYSEKEIRRIAETAFELAMKRMCRVTSVDKADVLESSRLWRRVVSEVAKDYPLVELDHMYVGNAAMQLVRNPRQFDVILTNNLFGSILSAEAGQLTGSIGMLPSASLGDDSFGLYEPIHGTAPDIAGTGKANPIATILSAAMMLRYTFDLPEEADAVENAVSRYLANGYRTADLLVGEDLAELGGALKRTTTSEAGDLIASYI